MKTIIKKIKVYSFNELDDAAQRKAIENNRDFNVDYKWWDSVYDWFNDHAKNQGFEVDQIYFSGFWSQGDGAMFEYSDNNPKILLAEFIETLNLSPLRKNWLSSQVYSKISGLHRGHYYHSGCCSHQLTFESDFTWSAAENFADWIQSFESDFEDFVISKYNDLCSELYNKLELEHDYLTSDECIIESLEINDYKFTADGEIY